jgi:hypothetical protein
MENIFIIGGALLAAHMLTRGGDKALSGLFSGGGAGGGATGAGMYQSEEQIDAGAYMREIRDERSYENEENPFSDFLSGLFGGGFFDQPTGEKIDKSLTSDEDLGIKVDVVIEAPLIEHPHGNLSPEKGGNLVTDMFQLPATFEGLKAEMPLAVGLEYDFDTGAIEVETNPGQGDSFSWENPLHIVKSNISSIPFTLQGKKELAGHAPVYGAELIQASQAGYGNIIEWRNAQDN